MLTRQPFSSLKETGSLLPGAERMDVVVGLEGVEEGVARRVGLDVGDRRLHVLGEAELRLLVPDGEVLPGPGDEAPGDAFVVGAEDQVEGLVAEGKFVVLLPHARALVHGGAEGSVHAAAQGLLEADGAVVGAAVAQGNGERGRGHDGDSFPLQGVGDLRRVVYAEHKAPVGRNEFVVARRGRETERQHQGCNPGKMSHRGRWFVVYFS